MSELKNCQCGCEMRIESDCDGDEFESYEFFFVVGDHKEKCPLKDSTPLVYNTDSEAISEWNKWNTRQPDPVIKAVYEKWQNYEPTEEDERTDHQVEEFWCSIKNHVEGNQ